MPISMDERVEMLQSASRSWLELKRIVDRLTDAQLNKPNTVGVWSGKELLAHIEAWEALAIDVINERDAGQEASLPDPSDEEMDDYSEEMVEPYREMSVAEVKQAMEDTHFTLMDLAESSPNVDVDTVLIVTARHYPGHFDDLRALMK